MRGFCGFLVATFLLLWTGALQAKPEWLGLPFDPFEGMDDCAKALVHRLVLDQKFPLAHHDFHRTQDSFAKLGIHFEGTEQEDIPLFIHDNLVSYEALSIHRVFRGDIVTEYVSVETRIGAPRALAERVNTKAFWHANETGFIGVLDGEYAAHGQTRGAAELLRLWLSIAGSEPALLEEIALLNREGHARQRGLAEEALDFYLHHLVRRNWSEETKKRLSREFFGSLRDSVLSISRLRSSGKIVGMLQNIRAPYGRRILARPSHKKLEILSDEVGIWGDSVRSFGIKDAEVRYLTNAELYDQMNENRASDGSLHLIRPPAEIKMREQGLVLPRTCSPTQQESICVNGEDLLVLWGSGEIDEPARLAVDRSQNPHLFVEILTQLLASAVDPHFPMPYNLHNRLHVTYNDRPSLYFRANFRASGQYLVIDGKRWPILTATGAEHIEGLRNASRPLVEGDARRLEEIKRAVLLYMDGGH